ncbi:MAG: bifunctional UDP-N-acetylglucosamine diphosphorylase/glucosamine-1-phosphate N-acetyltransferase GlmU [Chloroflexi bacterium]|nr:bifunctional UDP-N-acetylglucosamine diphosphorylase/glucosamine-1-phosphate N-acetyltransferase GlmU [Chloroflexota bacterium]
MANRRPARTSRWAAVVLAAGKGLRMRSQTPKVLHQVCGQPMALYPVQAARDAGIRRVAAVVGHGTEAVRATLGSAVDYVEQRQQRGTGHALLQARRLLQDTTDHLLVLSGDVPLVRAETLQRLMVAHSAGKAVITFLTATGGPTEGLGRVVRDSKGQVRAIVEETDATPRQRDIPEINSGVYCFDAAWLWPNLAALKPSAPGEIYLVDLVARAAREGATVRTQPADFQEVIGVNDRVDLAQAEATLRQRIRERWMRAGVTMIDPSSTFIDAGVELGQDVLLQPFTILSGTTRIGPACVIGPGATISNSAVGARCVIGGSVLEDATVEDEVTIGPFCHLRHGAYLERGVHLGNYVEVKESRLGRGTVSGHFSYIGDAAIGRKVNVGAGTITCNYDGKRKHPTYIEDEALIGSDTMLVAPVRLGRGSKTGAGAVVTRDVPPGATVVGVPARPLVKSGSAARRRGRQA